EVMFHKPGLVYTYTMHTHCLENVVSAEEGVPEAVLIRAVEPYSGIDLMYKRRPVKTYTNLTNGPGKLTKALGITMDDYGRTFYRSEEHTSELQSRFDLVCRLLLEKTKRPAPARRS